MAVTAPDAKPDEPLSNAEIQRRIGARVAEEFLSPGGGTARLNIGPLEVNYFSFVFRLDEGTGSDRREFFVKIPKSDLRGRQPVILPLSPEDAARRIPLGRAGRVEEVAQAVLMAISNPYLTGQTIQLNGGMNFI